MSYSPDYKFGKAIGRPLIRASFAATVYFIGAVFSGAAYSAETPKQYVREQRTVVVNGAKETWQLVWQGKPSLACGPDNIDDAFTCPCDGFAYGEYGKLSLVRRRGGHEIERMDLGPLFSGAEHPFVFSVDADRFGYLIRWPMDDDDLRRSDRGDRKLISDILHRPAPGIIHFADYSHDGHATQFLLEVGTMSCGHHQVIAVGVTANEPHLHALPSAANPNVPLVMEEQGWKALLSRSAPKPVTVLGCGDHGSDTQVDLLISAHEGKIYVKERDYSCQNDGFKGNLIDEKDD